MKKQWIFWGGCLLACLVYGLWYRMGLPPAQAGGAVVHTKLFLLLVRPLFWFSLAMAAGSCRPVKEFLDFHLPFRVKRCCRPLGALLVGAYALLYICSFGMGFGPGLLVLRFVISAPALFFPVGLLFSIEVEGV